MEETAEINQNNELNLWILKTFHGCLQPFIHEPYMTSAHTGALGYVTDLDIFLQPF